MTDKPEYRFKFAIVDDANGEEVWSDFCGLLPETIDISGICDSVDIHVSSMLRGFKRHVRDEYERENYPATEADGDDYADRAEWKARA